MKIKTLITRMPCIATSCIIILCGCSTSQEISNPEATSVSSLTVSISDETVPAESESRADAEIPEIINGEPLESCPSSIKAKIPQSILNVLLNNAAFTLDGQSGMTIEQPDTNLLFRGLYGYRRTKNGYHGLSVAISIRLR